MLLNEIISGSEVLDSILTEDLFQGWSELHCNLVDEIVAAEVWLLCISTLNDTHVELVDVGSQSQVDSLLQLGDVLVSSQLSNDGEAYVLNIENGVVDSFDIMLRDFHPC